MAAENVQEKQEAKNEARNENPGASAREALTNDAMNAASKVGGIADSLSKSGSMNSMEHLPGLSIGNSGEKHGIITTYDENGNATSDCHGPIPRVGDNQKPNNPFGKGSEGMLKDLDSELKFIHKDGVEKLSTGDYVVKKGDTHGFISKDGDSITVNPDGTYKIDGDVSKSTTDRNGNTTVEFKDGAVVKFNDGGIQSVTRDGHTVKIKEVKLMPYLEKPFPFKPGLGHIDPRFKSEKE